MNKYIFIFSLIFLATMVSAGTEDVMFKLKLEYTPNLETTCISEFDNSTNQTWNNCSTVSNGVIEVISGETETHVMIVENLLDIISGRIYTGYKTADLGNLSDITGINDKLTAFQDCSSKLNICMDSNRDVSSQLILLEEDRGTKSNFTTCTTDLLNANSDLNARKSELKTKNETIESLESSKFMWILIGIGIGAVFILVILPRLKGTDMPKDSSGNDHPPNPGY